MSIYTATSLSSRFRVTRNGVFNLPAANTRIQFNNIEFDRLNEYDETTTYLFTANKTGIYFFAATIFIQNPLAGTQRHQLTIQSTMFGIIASQQLNEDGTVIDQVLGCTGIRRLIAGEQVEARLTNFGAGARTTIAAWFSGFRIA